MREFSKTSHFLGLQGGSGMSGSAPIIIITEKQSATLNEFAASRSVSVSLSQRSRIVLMAFERVHNDEIAKVVGINRNQVGMWRHRWKAAFYDLVAVECSEGIAALKEAIVELLRDNHRRDSREEILGDSRTGIAIAVCIASNRSVTRRNACPCLAS